MFEIRQSPTSFYIGEDPDSPLAQVEVTYEDSTLTIMHTEVSETLKGQGAGLELLRHIVDFSREKGWTVNVQCHYARRQFEKNPEFHDVLKGGKL
ncbi:MAG TPA: GNAT family N-acetyltransferase [Clostridiaceae bacterium]|nr:GNAT family N-acetyltransferase [Clostridiaceae bacterium]